MAKFTGISNALLAAALFGLSTPAAKWLLGEVSPHLLAGIFYLGAGGGLALIFLGRLVLKRPVLQEGFPKLRSLPWLCGAILMGGVIGPVLLMHGLSHTDSARAALLLNLEGVFTAALAWFVFRENFDRRVVWGMVCIVIGGLVLSLPEEGLRWEEVSSWLGSGFIAGSCLSWAVDNNLTRKVSGADPVFISFIKGVAAGLTNIALAMVIRHETLPPPDIFVAALVVGFLGYGLSLVLFVRALRSLGAARTGAYFSTAPFCGACAAILIGQGHFSAWFAVAALLMTLGVWLHLSENHSHEHVHEEAEHEHMHTHDDHHRHEHVAEDPAGEKHSHRHRHARLVHSHPHYPDLHHQHRH